MFRTAALVMTAALATVAQAEKIDHRVEVDGIPYRVTVEDGVVTVAKKALLVTWTWEERDRQRTAVQKATGCSVVDEFPNPDNRLKGRLSCPTAGAAPSKP